MDKITIEQQLKKLETTLRLIGSNTRWLHLESIDANVLSEIQDGIKHHASETGQKYHTPQYLSEAEDQAKNSPLILEIEKNEAPKNIDLNPQNAKTLDSLHLRIKDCDRCPLCLERKTIVFGQGNIKADLMFIGEAPGQEEDVSGLAFVGKAGKLLTQVIQSIGINREAVYIGNVIKCRPPGNRNPIRQEIAACSPILFKQIELLKPKLIITLGNVATKTLWPNAPGIMSIRGKLNNYKDTPLLPSFHPSYLLRNSSALSSVWSDMRRIRQILRKFSPKTPSKTHPQEQTIHEG